MQQFRALLELADWRRRIAELYAEVRRNPDPEQAWRHWRATRDQMIRSHPQSPLGADQRRRFEALTFFDYDPERRLVVPLAPPPDESVQEWDIGADGLIRLRPFARTRGLANALGGELTVFWIGGYGGGLFLPFADRGNGTHSYGGGRYLLDGIKGADLGMQDDRLIVDFNFAYNPSCAYSDSWTCPLSPPENRLPQPVLAGESL